MKTLLLAVLLISGLSGTPADDPRNADEKHYDDALNALMQQITHDPAFAPYFVGGKTTSMHGFQRGRPGEWLDSRGIGREVKLVPAPSGTQVAFLEVVDTDHGISLYVFVQNGHVVMGPPRDKSFHIEGRPKLDLGYKLIVKDTTSDAILRKRLNALIRASHFHVTD